MTTLPLRSDEPRAVAVAAAIQAGKVEQMRRLLGTHPGLTTARIVGPHSETPLHWAAGSDDVAALDALLDRGANELAAWLESKQAAGNGCDG